MLAQLFRLPAGKKLHPDGNPLYFLPGLISCVKNFPALLRFGIHSTQVYFKRILATNLSFLILAGSFVSPLQTVTPVISNEHLKVPMVLQTKSAFQYPIANIRITTFYKTYHPGIDLDGTTGETILPIMRGRVEKIEISRYGYGKSVTVNHGDGLKSLYAHLSIINVVVGQEVNLDTKLGEMGNTGRSTGDHLHLEIYDNGETVNPLKLIGR